MNSDRGKFIRIIYENFQRTKPFDKILTPYFSLKFKLSKLS